MKKFLLGLSLLVAVVPALAQTTQKRVLPNGLTVLARENRGAPVVAVRVYVKTGSIYEGKLLGAGISHLFEHTLFEGTKTRDKAALGDELQAIGGQSNAYTSFDVTAYYVTTSKNYFARASNVLSDMIQNATFPEAELKVQQGVIHNEMNMGEDDPDHALYELWNKTAFRVHPVRHPIIGYREQFDAITRNDILNFHKTHYTPDNTILSVAGDVSPSEVFAQAAKDFGAWPRRAAQTPAIPSEPIQTAPRRAVEQRNVNLTQIQIGWRTVALQSPDLYALDVLSQILGGANSSRLPLELLQRKNVVQSVSSYSLTPNYDAGVFAIRATMPPKNATRVENLIRAQVRSIRDHGVSETELARAKNQIRAAWILGNQDVENQAEQSAYDEMGTGDPNYSARYLQSIQTVTPAQIQAVARQYLRDNGVTIALVTPKTTPSTSPKPTAQSAQNAGDARLIRLQNGLRVILRPSKGSPTVSVVLTGAGGVRSEPQNQAGIANFAAQLLGRGTKKRSGEEIARIVDELGGQMSAFSGYNSWGIESQWLASDWKRGLNLVAESALSPTFPSQEIEKVRAQVLASIAARNDEPMNAAGALLRRLFYANHPYSRQTLGTEHCVTSLSKAQIEAFWRASSQPSNSVLAIYGDFDPTDAEKAVRFLLGSWKAQATPLSGAPAVSSPPSFTSKIQTQEGIAQSVLFYGFPSIEVKNQDRHALDVLDAALSGAALPGGRLHAKLRDNELVYVVHAYNSSGVDGGMFVVYAATTPQNRAKAREIIEEEVQKVRDAQISQAELERAKSMTISARAIDLQTNSSQARDAASNELFGLGYAEGASYAQKINAVTLEDVQRVAAKYLEKNRAALAIVEPK